MTTSSVPSLESPHTGVTAVEQRAAGEVILFSEIRNNWDLSRRCCADSRLFEDDDDRDPLWNTLHNDYDLDDIFDEDAAER